jgi:hypothetical protein
MVANARERVERAAHGGRLLDRFPIQRHLGPADLVPATTVLRQAHAFAPVWVDRPNLPLSTRRAGRVLLSKVVSPALKALKLARSLHWLPY